MFFNSLKEINRLRKEINRLLSKGMYFSSIRVFFTYTDDSQDSRGREGTIFYSNLPLPPAYEH